jgi:non-homologous end joining protein Ku
MSTTKPETLHPYVPASWPGRASWAGFVQFGRVAFAVKAYPLTAGKEDVEFHQFHAGCGRVVVVNRLDSRAARSARSRTMASST